MSDETNKLRFLVINGPNLNMLGQREPEIYGRHTLADIHDMCRDVARARNIDLDFRQSNHEGEIVTWLQEALGRVDAIIINAAAYTHTSIAILDALSLHTCPVIEVHITDIKKREPFRHHSYISYRADYGVFGKGAVGYVRAMEKACELCLGRGTATSA